MPGGGGTTAKFTQTGMVSFPSCLSSTPLRYWNTLLCGSEISGAIVAACLVGVVGVDGGSSVSIGAGVDCLNFFLVGWPVVGFGIGLWTFGLPRSNVVVLGLG